MSDEFERLVMGVASTADGGTLSLSSASTAPLPSTPSIAIEDTERERERECVLFYENRRPIISYKILNIIDWLITDIEVHLIDAGHPKTQHSNEVFLIDAGHSYRNNEHYFNNLMLRGS